MGWRSQGNGYRGQSGQTGWGGRDEPFGQGEYGGWGSGEGQGEYGGQGYSNQGQFSGQYGDRGFSSQGYERQDLGWQNREPGRGYAHGQESGWQQSQFGPESGGYSQYRGQRGGEGYGYDSGGEGFGSQGTWQSVMGGRGGGQGWGFQRGGPGGTWGQGGGGWRQRSGERGSWSQGYGGQGSWGQGQPEGWSQSGGQGFGQQGRFGSGPRSFYYEEVWLIPGPHTGRGPQGYQRSDQRIEEDVCERLSQHGQLDASGIQVAVNNGEVTLNGIVDSRQDKRMAEDMLDAIPGVKDIHNQLRVEQGQTGPQGQPGQTMPTGQSADQGSTTQSRAQSQSRNQTQRNETAKAGAATS
jgi:hypothetical protein